MIAINGSKFITEIAIRPSDIDMNQHVHNTEYLDYVLAARYDQMTRCYKMSMEEFVQTGFNWWIRKTYIEYKRSLKLGDVAVVTTWVEEYERSKVIVKFEIHDKESQGLSATGYLEYVYIHMETGRPTAIPEEIITKYSV